ncbi:MAG: DegV family protein [Firmicutes bacterium]|nr:DegV family protein [Bacillota bacterium]
MAIRIITDSASDLPISLQKELGITIMQVPVFIEEKEYVNDGSAGYKDFYTTIAKLSAPPKTAQINPYRMEEEFKHWLGKSNEIIGMFMSSELSGTHQSALMARNMLDGQQIYIVDTKNITVGLGLLVLEAVRLRDAGMTARDIYERLSELKNRVKLFAVVDTLKYLKMGGRISGTAALIGTMLNIKPLVQVFEGKVLPLAKAKGYSKAVQEIFGFIEKHPIDTALGAVIAHSDALDGAQGFARQVKARYDVEIKGIHELGPALGSHVGPGGIGIAYFEKK